MTIKKHLIPVEEYKEPIEFAEKQLEVFWLPTEIKVEKDVQDVLVNFTEAERHGVISVLKLFSLYETHAGDEYWGRRYKEMFDGAEFHRMASVFSMFELAVHGPFYNKINQLLSLDTTDFYTDYQNSPTLAARVEHLGQLIDHPDDLVSLAAFSMVEGVILYSQFAFLLHFQSEGKNKLSNIARGINFSVRDENLHSMAGAWSFKLKLQTYQGDKDALKQQVFEAARTLYEHEKEIVATIFEKGKIPGITEAQLVHFVESRINLCLANLGYEKMFNVTYDPISAWFYKGINDYQFNDFFSGVGREYNRDWDESGFKWRS